MRLGWYNVWDGRRVGHEVRVLGSVWVRWIMCGMGRCWYEVRVMLGQYVGLMDCVGWCLDEVKVVL